MILSLVTDGLAEWVKDNILDFILILIACGVAIAAMKKNMPEIAMAIVGICAVALTVGIINDFDGISDWVYGLVNG